ncbi:MAG TPA: VOC family protein [Mucilaginibacter sp.]|jgi:PhnB protein|nr:VOC family protein [Mucilaginibacter sp.]
MKLIPYLHFNGNCEEALNTYKEIFGGTGGVTSRFSDAPSFPVPDDYKNKVMHGNVMFDDNTIFMSDCGPGRAVIHGDGTAMSIGLSDETKTQKIFDQLAEGGTVIMPLAKQFWGATFGQLVDKYGIRWMLNCQ